MLLLLPEILKVPCDCQFVPLLLGLRVLTAVATPLLGRGCGSLDSALGLSARCGCAPLEAAASLYTRCGPEVDYNSWPGPAHFLALEVCLNSSRAPSAPPSAGLAEASVCVCVLPCVCTCQRGLGTIEQILAALTPGPPLILLPSASGCYASLTPGTQCLLSPVLSVGK